jgi:chromate transporter
LADGETVIQSGAVSYGELFATFGKIGLLSFGGPAGQFALMHRILIDEKKWLDEDRYLHALNFCMLLPGPEAMQLATYAGWLLRGVTGGLIAGLLFVLPGFSVMIALAAIYVAFGDVPLVQGVLFGLAAAVLAIVIEALLRVGKRALVSPFHVALAVAAFAVIAFLKAPFPLIVLAAGLIGLWLPATVGETKNGAELAEIRRTDDTPLTSLVWAAIWLVPLALLWFGLGRGNVFADMAWFFSKAAVVTFGGAYAVLAYVGQQAADIYGWLTPQDMVTGLGLAETTPGPLILVLVFVGFLGAANLSGLEPLTGGMLGAATALWFTFAPCFLWIFAGAPFVERLRHVAWIRKSLSGITAAVVGVIANLAVWFALHVLFGDFREAQFGPLTLPQPAVANLDWRALLIAAFSGIALLLLHINLFAVLGGAAIAGILFTTLG